MSESESGAHILIFPYAAHGHMTPLLNLSHLLATRGLTITILVTPKNLPLLRPLLSLHPSTITPLVLPFPSHPSIPAGVENTADLPAGGFRSMLFALSELHDPIVDWFRRHPSPPTAIISDMFLGWTQDLTVQLGIRRYCFSPSGAFAFSTINSLWRDLPHRDNPDDTLEFSDVPGSPIYPWWQVSPIFRSYVGGEPFSEFLKGTFRGNAASHGLVVNTFDELEGSYLEYLKKELGHDKVWSIGPVLPPGDVGLGLRNGSGDEVLSWLDTCSERSVVYVCFGSQAVLNNEQLEELALGLEKSGVKFILAYKGPTKGHVGGDYGVIPDGFEDRVAGRGLVVKGWVPQVLILRHKSVCAYLTHCGWNSTLESIVAGVPMLAWPMGADQFINATLLVDCLDVAVKVCEGDEVVLKSDDLARVLVEATSEKWKDRRARSMALKKAAYGAINEGGGSFHNLDDLVRDLSHKSSM